MTLRIRLYLMSAFLLMSVSCSDLLKQVVKSPVIDDRQVKVVGADLKKVDLELQLDITNPNSFSLPLEKLEANLDLYDKPFLSRRWQELPTLQPNQKTSVKLPLTLEWQQLLKIGTQLIGSRQMPYSIKGLVIVKGFNIPFNKQGTVDLEHPDK